MEDKDGEGGSDDDAWRWAHDRQTERAVAGEGVRGYTRRGASVAALNVVCVGEGGRSEAPCPY